MKSLRPVLAIGALVLVAYSAVQLLKLFTLRAESTLPACAEPRAVSGSPAEVRIRFQRLTESRGQDFTALFRPAESMQSAGWDSQFWSTPVPDELSAAGSWSLGIGSDPFLSQYRALPAEDRKYDILVRANYFWESDYRLLVGWVVPYDAQFVIHLKPVSEDMTEVHIFQKNVRIVAWKKFGFSIGHGVLGFHDDFRVVPPSTLETCKMFDLLLVEPEG